MFLVPLSVLPKGIARSYLRHIIGDTTDITEARTAKLP